MYITKMKGQFHTNDPLHTGTKRTCWTSWTRWSSRNDRESSYTNPPAFLIWKTLLLLSK